MDGIRDLDSVDGARAVLEQARVNQIDAEANVYSGLGVEPFAPFRWLVDAWQHGRPNSSTGWIDELAEQVRVASHWRNPGSGGTSAGHSQNVCRFVENSLTGTRTR